MEEPLKTVTVVIAGTHTKEWNEALSADAPVWRLLPNVAAVRTKEGLNTKEKAFFTTTYCVQIPLLEKDIEYQGSIPSLIPNRLALDTFRDKERFSRFVVEHSLQKWAPTTFKSKDRALFPCVLKRVDLNASTGIEVVTSREHLEALLQQPPWQHERYILQEYVEGSADIVTHCVSRNGKILWHKSYSYPCEPLTIRRSAVPWFHYDLKTEHLSVIERFLSAIKFTGPCNVDARSRPDGSYAIFEINPRLGGSLMFPENLYDLRDALYWIIEGATATQLALKEMEPVL